MAAAAAAGGFLAVACLIEVLEGLAELVKAAVDLRRQRPDDLIHRILIRHTPHALRPIQCRRVGLRLRRRSRLAVGETVIFAGTPSPSILKHLLKGEGGAAE